MAQLGTYSPTYIPKRASYYVPAGHVERCVKDALQKVHGGTADNIARVTVLRLGDMLKTLIELNHQGRIRADQAFIAGRMGKSIKSVYNSLTDLKELGLIEIIKYYDTKRQAYHNVYALAGHVYLFRKGKQLAEQAKEHIKAAANAGTTKLSRKLKELGEYYEEKAKQNLRQNFLSTDKKPTAELSSLFSKENQSNKCPPSAGKVFDLVRLIGAQKTLDSLRSHYGMSWAAAGRLIRGANAPPNETSG